MVSLVKHDLEFILKQIKIAEAHSSGTSLAKIYVDAAGNVVPEGTPNAILAISDPLAPYGLRTVDGSWNNLTENRDQWGASDHPFTQITDPYPRNEGDDAMPFPGYVPVDPNSPTGQNNNYGAPGSLVDADPRIISNLIVDQTLSNPAAIYAALVHGGYSGAALNTALNEIKAAYKPMLDAEKAEAAWKIATVAATTARAAANKAPDNTELDAAADAAEAARDSAKTALDAAKPLADAAKPALAAKLAQYGVEMEGDSVVIPNVSPDEGLSAPYNSWFTLFGQFFDHGLDLVAKKGGTIYIPLSPDDPLYNPDSPRTNFMVLTRILEDADNTTTPWVDQNQTYGSTASKQLFMREYELDADGKPVATGRLLEGSNGGLATWAEVKAQARTVLGIELTDADVGQIPLFLMDPYGEFIPGDNGFPQLVLGLGADGKLGTPDDVLVEGNRANPINPSTVINPVNGAVGSMRTDHAFLDDIAHAAQLVNSRGQIMYADDDTALGVGNSTVDNPNFGQPVVSGQNGNSYLLQNLQKVALNPAFNENLPESALNPRYLDPATRFYDDELLDAHFITGDGRGNENIGLTAVHHVFHSEHNHTVDQVMVRAVQAAIDGDAAFLREWLTADVTVDLPSATASEADILAFAKTLTWDGERLFQAARFTTEMQYQHLVFEEFARKVQPDVDAFVFNPSTDIDPVIFAEFAHVVYRFGHSMLNQTVDRISEGGADLSLDLFGAFLNPTAYAGTQKDSAGNSIVLDHDQAAGAIVRGMTNQVGNEIDEFVTDVLRNQLLGIPLDLAAINIARGRDAGIPPLNEARRQFQEIANGDTQLEAYTSWTDFALNLKNPASIVNFIAAYGTHSSITSAKTVEAKRDAAMLLVFGGEGEPADRLAFLNATGSYAGGKLGGLEDVDLWVGGLAEKKMAFGGMLGSTFSFIFELQLENLQNADRFYYLSRVQGLNFLNELENNSFAKMVLNNTDLGETGYALPGDIFSTPDHVLYMDHNKQNMFNYEDPQQEDPFLQAFSPMIERRDASGNLINPESNPNAVATYIRVNTNDHVLIQGTNGAERIISGGGDDSVWGLDGNDTIEAGYGVDKIHGGKGDDIITNNGTDIGEVDMLHGEEGNDVIHAGSGLALVFGNQGHDFLITGPDGKEAFGGTGNDFILGGEGGDFLLGNEGDDWLEAGNGFDTTAGDNSELFFNSTIIGHDVMFAGQNEHDFDAESGDDIMVQGESVMRNEGMWGFDWAIHKGSNEAADADLLRPIFTTDQQDILRNRYDQVEALSGWDKNDVLRGDNRGSAVDGEGEVEGTPGLAGAEGTMAKQELTQAGVDRIDGMRALLGDWVSAPTAGDRETQIAFDDGNILLGGGGSDVIEGRGGNDVVDGDKWLNVRIKIEANGQTYSAERMGGKVYLASDFVEGVLKAGAVAQFGGKTLDALMLNATLNPGQLSIVREIVKDDGAGDTDIAVFSDVSENYTFTRGTDGSYIVSHTGFDAGNAPDGANLVSDGTDKLWNIERLRFADGEFDIGQFFNTPATGAPTINDLTPTEGQTLTASTAGIADADGITTAFSYQWQMSTNGGASWTNVWDNFQGTSDATFVPNEGILGIGSQVGNILRVAVSFTDSKGNVETVFSAPTGVVGDDWNGIPFLANTFNGTAGDDIADGSDPIVIIGGGNDTLNGNGGNDQLNGRGGNDNLNGGAGNDRLDGGAGTGDVAIYTGGVGQFALGSNGTNLIVTDLTGAEGTDTLSTIETLRFNGANYGVVLGTTGSTTVNGTNGANGSQAVFGLAGNDTVNGGAGNDLLVGGEGNDVINGGNDTDTIYWTAGDGRDRMDGGAGTDTVKIVGDTTAETYRIYSRQAADAAGFTGLNANTEIVITRNGTDNASIIAELDNIEEIVINGMGGGDTFIPVGTFAGTSLLTSTITLEGTDGDDVVDITSLQSAHRIVFKSNGGNDTIVGTLRAQDVIELAPGLTAASYTKTVNENGSVTLTSEEHSITYRSDGNPIIKEREEDEDEDEDHDDDNQSGTDKPVVTGERYTIKKGEALQLTTALLLANDLDLDGGELSIIEIDEDEHGTAVLNQDGTITFTPKAGFTGEAFFTYTVADGQGGYAEGKVSITVEKPAPAAEIPGPVAEAPKPISVNGGRGNDRLHGDEANDRLKGGDGHDHLNGGAGADKMWGGRGNDTYTVDDRGDKVYESKSQGTDTVKASVSYTLGSQVEKLVLTGTADLNGTGNSLHNSLTGNSGDNVLKGQGGHDTLKGMAGNDKVYGGSGDDRLDGGSGNDRVDGGSGSNRLTGGSGDDVFVFNKKHGIDTVTDFRTDHDRIDVSGLAGVNSMADLTLTNTAHGVAIGHAAAILVLNGVKESDLDSSDFIF